MKVQAYVEGAQTLPEKEIFLRLRSDPSSHGVDLVLVDRNGVDISAPYLLRVFVGHHGKLVLDRIGSVNPEFVEWESSRSEKIRVF